MNIDTELQNSRWITAPEEFETAVFIKKFTLTEKKSVKIALSTLGHFLLYVNGKRVGNEYFLPANSIYGKRDTSKFLYPIHDELTYRSYYEIYDITEYTLSGENTLEIEVANGWYRQAERIAEGNMAFGTQLGTIFAIAIADGKDDRCIHSDGSETCRTTKTVKSDLFFGEVYDARITDYEYSPVGITDLPDTLLTFDDAPPDRITRTLTPKLLFTDNGRAMYDVGENVSGFVQIKTSVKAGEEVRIRFADAIRDGELDYVGTGVSQISLHGKEQIMQDVFIGNGKENVFEPKFVWHAFRYFEIFGDAVPLAVKVVHSDVAVTSAFNSSSDELNWLYNSYIRGQLDNMHQGVPLDCPHRERLGYTGDGQACAPSGMMLLDSEKFYKKWIRDIFDSQCKISGHVNHTAPFNGGGGGPGGWGMAAITVPYNYYKYFGDITPAKENYDGIKHWIEYLLNRSEDGLIVREEEGGWCLGDWASPEEMQLPPDFVNTCLFIRALKFAVVLAKALKKDTDVAYFENIAKTAKDGVMRKYYDKDTGSFATKRQGADAFALVADLGDKRTLDNLLEFYDNAPALDTGFLANELLTEILFENGAEDIALKLISSHEVGGFGYCMDKGATTIWESYHGWASLNHPMFGACVRMLFSGILGITQSETSVAYNDLLIEPRVPSTLDFAEGHVQLKCGKISVKWQKENAKINFTVTLPKDKTAMFRYNSFKTVLHGGENIISL